MAVNNYDLNTVKGRLMTYLKFKRISQVEFCRSIDVASTYIAVMRKSISTEKVNRIVAQYPDLNREWLLYGEGDMLLTENQDPKDILHSAGYLVPLLPVNAFAGNISAWSQTIMDRDCEKVVSPIQGVDFAIRISGDSMEPDFKDASLILIKKIDDNSFIPWGHPMIIDTINGVFFKNVFPSERGQRYIEARSINSKYPPLTIPLDSVFGLYRLVGNLNTFSSY
ncbi:MAG: S24 family peptidase [Muribaculum sp.]|nr:S24 family peptidase [Muribaculum sp.]